MIVECYKVNRRDKIIAFLLPALLFVMLLPIGSCADESLGSGRCGDSVLWEVLPTGELHIYGEGSMDDYRRLANWGSTAPWYDGYCDQIKSISVDDGVINIGEGAFANLYYVTHVQLPDSLLQVGADAFYHNDKLEQVCLPKAVESIGQEAFGMCRELNYIEVDAGNPFFANDKSGVLYSKDFKTLYICPAGAVFQNYTVDQATEKVAEYAFYDSQGCGNVILQEGVKEIGTEAFYSADGLTGINIPASVHSIGERALSGCINLKEIPVHQGNESFLSDNGLLFNKNKTKLVCFPSGQIVDEFSIPDGVEIICSGAFLNTDLKSVIFSEDLKRIESYAFEYCMLMNHIEFPQALEFIGHDAFFNCLQLQTIVIPSNVEEIEYRAFYHCDGDVYFLGDAPSIGQKCFAADATIHFRNNTIGWDTSECELYSLKSFSPNDSIGIDANFITSRGTVTGIQVSVTAFPDRIAEPESICVTCAVYDEGGRMTVVETADIEITGSKTITVAFSGITQEEMLEGITTGIFAFGRDSFCPCCAPKRLLE